MAQEYTVTKAFQSKDRDTKEPQVIKTANGEMHKYMVQVENQPVQGWMGILKKPGNEVNEGDVLYGDITENDWGKPQFKRADRPFGGQSQAPQAPQQSSGGVTNEQIMEELKYVRGLLENRFQDRSQAAAPSSPADDDGPVDLSALDY